MQLIGQAVPKTTSQQGDRGYADDGLYFCTAEEGISQTLKRYCGGKILFVADSGGFGAFASFTASPRAISFVFDGDALPLFSMPDGVSCILACGGKNVLQAVRYFALVRHVPCVLFPTCASLQGATEAQGDICLSGDLRQRPLAEGEIYCDTERMKDSFPRAYARLLLAKLSVLESEALQAFSLGQARRFTCSADDLQSIVRSCRTLTGDVMAGEGFALAEYLEEAGENCPEWTAYFQLTALYAAFFERGKPRRFFTPDYTRRAKAVAGEVKNVPTAEEYARRALLLERVRARFLLPFRRLAQEREGEREKLFSLAREKIQTGKALKWLKYLPELHKAGLSCLIRDFGLMEWED